MFRKAERKKAKLRLALCGVSGSGKTYSSILLAKGIGGKIAMIDTENHSGELYSHLTDYDVMTIGAPFDPLKYISAIKEAEISGYNVLIIDSLTHAWAAEGGLLNKHADVTRASATKNSYTAWRDVSPIHDKLVNAMLQSNLHIIATMRSKTEHVMSTKESGRSEVSKIGLAPIQREGMDYEFTTVLDISHDGNIAKASKDRTEIMAGVYEKPSEEMGKRFFDWLNSGAETPELEISAIKESMINSDSLETLKGRFGDALKFLELNRRNDLVFEITRLKDEMKAELSSISEASSV